MKFLNPYRFGWGLLVGFQLLFATAAFSANTAPNCLGADTRILPVINSQVLAWKDSTPNQFHARGHIEGTLQEIYPDHGGHHHWQVQIGSQPGDNIEVIYNQDFGAIPTPYVGMNVEACGDFINSNAPTPMYPASPDGAIIHWVHMNPDGKGHLPGFLMMDGTLCGQDPSHAGPKRP